MMSSLGLAYVGVAIAVGLWISLCFGLENSLHNYTCTSHEGITHHGAVPGSKPQIHMKCPKKSHHMVNQLVEISCKVIANPAARIQWQRNGKNVTLSSIILKIDPLSCNQHLRIYPVTLGHSGTYTCIASNMYGKAMKSCQLLIRETMPKLYNSGIIASGAFSNGRAIVGSPVNLTCTVFNAFFIHWRKDGQVLKMKPIQERYSSTIAFHKIARNDSGNYTCIGANYGHEQVAYKLLLIEKKPLVGGMRSTAVFLSSGVTTLTIWVLSLLLN